MATITAQILVGHPNKLGNGMLPTHCLLLAQGSKPVWILKSLDILENEKEKLSTIRWVPTEENLLEDALLLISVNVLKDKKLIDNITNHIKNISSPLIDLNTEIALDNLKELHHINRSLQYDYKLVITCFTGSALNLNLESIKEYSMDVEICTPSYNRYYNPWIDNTVIKGNLV
ncbi:MAG: hypothetical protein GX895_04385 [Clostridiales bacterium]|uniref:hypothetical protein n=1 Tax=Clostridium sp. N3C TaxID=1776758 RepID=UPI00092DF365|nr:hypothetical protein [Clostridium sp. N3C]NLZ48018.1 hypothetical protein [Clostridiales bacterium]SCN23332.1 hypothetical protein N3C_1252 [Clostridium sp. N3C]